MKVVALVSGGKDSCFAMQQCILYGHEIVALANLFPTDDSIDELDSYMYQTVGHQMVAAYAQCMGLPLFRRRIKGSARVLDLKYKETEGDEVEDLEILLRTVKAHFPTITGVSSGAIASDYQRLRVESVCSRLGLVSLAFLWKQDQALLLQKMIDSGIHAILVKVAAMGLDPHKHLGKDLATLQPHFIKLNEKHGCNICGEGGEYESLTLDCPLFKNARIILEESEIILCSPDTYAPVGILHPKKYRVEPKISSMQLNEYASIDSGAMIWVLEVGDNINRIYVEEQEEVAEEENVADGGDENLASVNVSAIRQENGFLTLSCWKQAIAKPSDDVGDELGVILTSLEAELIREGLGWLNVLFVHLYIDSMQHFARANEVYMQHITEKGCEKGVPSRCTVEVPLAMNNFGLAMVEVLASTNESKRVLHVQSISCWAPSCIGPYSQATHHENVLHVAGQLGLDPPTMSLVTGGAGKEMEQALFNSEAVCGAFGASLVTSAISFTVYCSSLAGKSERRDIKSKLEGYLLQSCEPSIREAVSRLDLSGSRRPVLYVVVPALPKGALVEVEPLLYVPPVDLYSDEERYTGGGIHLHNFNSGLLFFYTADGCVRTAFYEHKGAHGVSSLKRSTIWNDYIVLSGEHPVQQTDHYFASAAIQSLSIHENFCRALISVKSKSESQKVQRLGAAVESCLEALLSTLERAKLTWEDVLVFRIYAAIGTSLDHFRSALQEVWSSRGKSTSSGFAQATIVPISGVGMSATAEDMFAVELLASRQS